MCATDCIDRTHFPLDTHPHLSSIYGYKVSMMIVMIMMVMIMMMMIMMQSGDKCCRRRCPPHTKCGHNIYGCQTDEDCNREAAYQAC